MKDGTVLRQPEEHISDRDLWTAIVALLVLGGLLIAAVILWPRLTGGSAAGQLSDRVAVAAVEEPARFTAEWYQAAKAAAAKRPAVAPREPVGLYTPAWYGALRVSLGANPDGAFPSAEAAARFYDEWDHLQLQPAMRVSSVPIGQPVASAVEQGARYTTAWYPALRVSLGANPDGTFPSAEAAARFYDEWDHLQLR